MVQFPRVAALPKPTISEKGLSTPDKTPPASRGILTPGAVSVDMEKQTHTATPYSLAGSTNVSLADAKEEERGRRTGLGRYLLSEIDPSWTDVILVICGFISGLVDGLSFTYWKSFSDMQTGNIIWAALGVAGKPDDPENLWVKALIAVAAFLLGTLCFIYSARLIGPRRRLSLIFSFLLQTLLLMGAAIISQTNTISNMPNQIATIWMQDVAIAFLAFQAAGQILASKHLGYPEIPTVALTALMCDLLLDEKLLQRPWGVNPKRNRKVGFIVVLTLGSMVAGAMAKGPGLAAGLWLAMAMKAGITIAFMVWKEA